MPETMCKTETFNYSPEAAVDTCKTLYEFKLSSRSDGTYIEDLIITGPKGCVGHPKTLSALLKGRKAEELPLEDLSLTGCVRKSSCGQEMAKAISAIINSKPVQ